jgi:erythritol transport system permease protein
MFSISKTFVLLGIIAVGQGLVMLSGGIDLTVGSTFGFAGIILATLHYFGYGFEVTLFAGLAAGCCIGLINGLLVSKLGFKPFIATFGMLAIIRAVGYLTYQVVTKNLGGASVMGTIWTTLASWRSPLWLPPSFLILIAFAVGVWLLMKRTRFGLWASGTGGNLDAARAVGVPVHKVRILTYVICGALAAVAGMLGTGNLQSVGYSDGAGMELTSIAAVIIGGASLAGGSLSIVGTLLAVLLIVTIVTGVAIMGVEPYYQGIVTGLTVLLALVLTRLSFRKQYAGD